MLMTQLLLQPVLGCCSVVSVMVKSRQPSDCDSYLGGEDSLMASAIVHLNYNIEKFASHDYHKFDQYIINGRNFIVTFNKINVFF